MSMRKPLVLVLVVLLLLVAAIVLSGCASKSADSGTSSATEGGQGTSGGDAETTTSQEEQLYTPSYKPNGKEVAVIKTNKGTITVQLYGKEAPTAVGSFVELVQKGFYNGLKFHRLEPNFVIQGGDPQTKDLSSEQVKQLVANQNSGNYTEGDPMLGTGGPGYTLKGEFTDNPHKHVDGTLAAARSNSPDSAGSQFYFTLGPQSFLDGQYTVFGQTTEGLDVVHQLVVGDVIETVTIENANE